VLANRAFLLFTLLGAGCDVLFLEGPSPILMPFMGMLFTSSLPAALRIASTAWRFVWMAAALVCGLLAVLQMAQGL
jgi:hypothetical protein